MIFDHFKKIQNCRTIDVFVGKKRKKDEEFLISVVV